MALRLRVVSEQRRALGDRASIVVGVGGTSIGRAADNDWVLPDPHRYMSGRHARIHFRQGAFYLEDTSTNGIFLNDSDLPVSRQGLYCLRNGDLLRLGEYQLVVTFEAGTAGGSPSASDTAREAALTTAAPNSTAAAPAPAAAPALPLSAGEGAESVIVTKVEVGESTGRLGNTDLGASLNLQALLDSSPSDSFRAVNAFGQAVATPFGSRAPEVQADAEAEAVARRLARLSRAVTRTRSQANASALYDVQTGLNAFCRGAGIDATRLPADAQTRMLHLAGQLFRESLVGLRDLNRCHHEFRNRLRIELPREEDPTRPSLTRGGVEELSEALLQSHDSRRIDAVQWLRTAFEDAKEHVSATSGSTQRAFAEFILRLEPADLEARFGRAAKRGRAAPDKADYWDLYAEFYRNLCEMPPDGLPHLFVEAFARAYLELFRPSGGGGGEGA
jgi:type VI secretion system protein